MITNKISRIREKQTRYLSQAIQLEEAVNPHIVRVTMSLVSLAVIAFVAWAGFTNINEVARTPGEVVPKGFQQTVQHLDGGLVKAIYVQEGQIVEAGDVLLRIESAGVQEDLEKTRSKQLSLEMQEERLRAFTEGREPDFKKFGSSPVALQKDQAAFFDGMKAARDKEKQIIIDQLTQKEQSIKTLNADLETAQKNHKIVQNMYSRRLELNKKGYASDMDLFENESRMNELAGDIQRLTNQIEVAQSEIKEFKGRLSSLEARHRDEALEKLDAVATEETQNKEILQKLEDRLARSEVRAPVRGLVKGLSVNTVGAVINPGQVLMEIVPIDEELEVQVKISPKDIGHLKPGQPVQMNFSSFDFARYGLLEGTLETISASTFSGENGERYYRGQVRLARNYVGQDPHNTVMPGMTVMADIVTGEKTILEYLLKPIHLSLKSAFRER
ncbi:MAG: HlyD family type I secretion periplasmic adaptor subunit [Alphaproteobacteria bacterium]|nr:HlyD family type I secretion periplasmic adaptor subunit [Alphaproteobacteria bacterium]